MLVLVRDIKHFEGAYDAGFHLSKDGYFSFYSFRD